MCGIFEVLAVCGRAIMAVFLTTMVGIGIFACHGKEKLEVGSSHRLWTSTVDWYKPPPNDFPDFRYGTGIPFELIKGVDPRRIDEAIALLGDADILQLTEEQAAQLSFARDPDAVLRSLMKQRVDKLRFSLEHPIDVKKSSKQTVAIHQIAADELKSDIKKFREWEHRLKPYLIKAVTLGGTTPFGARLVSEDLLVVQIGVGQHPVPMKRMPVVAFLPMKPRRIYNDIEMMK
jgi:hypothetical protein